MQRNSWLTSVSAWCVAGCVASLLVTIGQPGASAADTACRDAYFVAARGSGEVPGANSGDLKDTPELLAIDKAMVDALQSAGSRPDLEVHNLRYPAPPVQELTSKLDVGSLGDRWNRLLRHNLPSYLSQEQQGERELMAYLNQILAACAGTGKHPAVVLAGYSQGAMVVHNTLQTLVDTGNTAAAALIAGAVLVADPERMPQSQVRNLGTAPQAINSFGICSALDIFSLYSRSCLGQGHPREIPPRFRATTIALCNTGDAVCDTASLIGKPPLQFKFAVDAGVFTHIACHAYCGPSARNAGVFLAEKLLALGVGLTPLSVATQNVATGTVGTAYIANLTAQGGAQPYTWSIGAGLPAGLALSVDGTISGVPTAAGESVVNVTATDSLHHTATTSLTVTINPPTNGLTINSGSGRAGVVSWVTGITCPTPAPGGTMWVITQGAGQPAPDPKWAATFPLYHGGTYVASDNNAVVGSALATIDCAENQDSSSPAGAVTVKGYSFTQTITGPTANLVIDPANDGLPGYRFKISDDGGCGTSPHGLFGVSLLVTDHAHISPRQLVTGFGADTAGHWGPVTMPFPAGPTVSWDVQVFCSIAIGQDYSMYYYPIKEVQVP